MSRFNTAIRLLATFVLITFPFMVDAAWIPLHEGSVSESPITYLGENEGQLIFEWSSPGIEISDNEEATVFSMPGQRAISEELEKPVFSGLVRLPWRHTANLIILEGTAVKLNGELDAVSHPIPLDETPIRGDWAEIGNSSIFRDITVAPLVIHPVQESEDGMQWIANHLRLAVEIDGVMPEAPPTPPVRPVSREFFSLYNQLVLNELDDLGTRLAARKGTLLIVTHQMNVNNLQTFVSWKKQKGYTVTWHTFDASPTPTQLRDDIRDYYYSLDPPLEYVLFVGDENRGGDRIIPAYERIVNPGAPAEQDVTDWPYAYIEGDDYLPEVFIGRMPAGEDSEVMKASRRVITYEKTPFLVDNETRWRSAVLVAGNYAEGGLTPYTPVSTSEWLADRLRHQWWVPNVAEIYWRQGYPDPPSIANAINAGTMWVTYRGWGNAEGWVRPSFQSGDVDALLNVNTLPVICSFVCNTGDFGNPNYPKEFATHCITAGTVNSPVGFVTAIAPSDLHTSTKFNNPLLSGFFMGVYEEHLLNISAALLRAKMEIYYGHPNDQEIGELVPFYWAVYHVLGDPTLQMWRHRPRTMQVSFPDTIQLGQDFLTVAVTRDELPLPDAYVNVIQNGEILDGVYSNEMGIAQITMLDAAPGEAIVTVTREDHTPVIDTVVVEQAEASVGVSGWLANGGDQLFPGETAFVAITLRNYGSLAQDQVTATLSHPDEERVIILQAERDFGSLASGEEATRSFEFVIDASYQDEEELEFNLTIEGSGGPWQGKIWLPVNSISMQFVEMETQNGEFAPGHNVELFLYFQNVGSHRAEGIYATLVSWDEAVHVETATAMLRTTAPGETNTTQTPFSIYIEGGTYHGRQGHFEVQFSHNGDLVSATGFVLTLEGGSTSDPLGPDRYGYYAYDNTDTDWEEAPVYEWPDLEHNESAALQELSDDQNFFIEMPFDFVFYGYSTNHLTVSSNGWLSLWNEEDYTKYFFCNWNITGSIGPHYMIAPFWDDLKSLPEEPICVYTLFDNGKFIIEWENCVNNYGYNRENYRAEFAVILFDPVQYPTTTGDGIIEFHYRRAENRDQDNNYATVGIHDRMAKRGLEYTYAFNYPPTAAHLASQRAIRFTTTAPDQWNPKEDAEREGIPEIFQLYPVYPNPFNTSTEISFDLAVGGRVRLAVYNLLGQEIALLVDREMSAGHKTVAWDVSSLNLSSGLLLYHLESGENSAWGKMMYVK